jgi:hypothetical protein
MQVLRSAQAAHKRYLVVRALLVFLPNSRRAWRVFFVTSLTLAVYAKQHVSGPLLPALTQKAPAKPANSDIPASAPPALRYCPLQRHLRQSLQSVIMIFLRVLRSSRLVILRQIQ